METKSLNTFFWQPSCTHPPSLALLPEKFFCSYGANNSERGCVLCVSGVCVLMWVCVCVCELEVYL